MSGSHMPPGCCGSGMLGGPPATTAASVQDLIDASLASYTTTTDMNDLLDGKASITTESLQIWVNGTTGNDSNNGTAEATPKLTIGAGDDLLPNILRHNCTLNLRGTFSSLGTIRLAHLMIDQPAAATNFVIDGGPDVTTVAGPFTSTAASTTTATDTTQTWTVDAYRGYQLQWTSGAANGHIGLIKSNSATVITLCTATTVTPSAGDTFIVCRPTTEIASTTLQLGIFAGRLSTVHFTRIYLSGTTILSLQTIGCQLTFQNVVDNSSSVLSIGGRGFGNITLGTTFILNPTTYAVDATQKGGCSQIHASGAIDAQIGQVTASLLVAERFNIQDHTSLAIGSSITACRIKRMQVFGGRLVSGTQITGVSTNKTEIGEGSAAAGLLLANSGCSIGANVTILGATTHGLDLQFGSRVRFDGAAAINNNTLFGIRCMGGSGVIIKDGAPPTFSGNGSGEISFDGSAAIAGGIGGIAGGSPAFTTVDGSFYKEEVY